MVVYNLTIKVQEAILEDWLVWELQEHIPAVMATGLFDGYAFHRLLEQDESEGPTFVLQYQVSSLERYRQYLAEFSPAFQRDGFNKWGNGFIAFRTIMEELATGVVR
jgi:Domain of unknown function (DUF4286)